LKKNKTFSKSTPKKDKTELPENLMPGFEYALQAGSNFAGRKERLFQLLKDALQKLKDPKTQQQVGAEAKEQVLTFVRLLRSYGNGTYREIPWNIMLRIAGALFYFIWVLDVIPDFIPVFGFIDDLAIIAWVYQGIKKELDAYLVWEKKQ